MKHDGFSNQLKRLRALQGLTQTEIAKKLFVTPQTVSKWENGNALPDVENLCKLAEILQTTPNDLLGVNSTAEEVFIGIDSGGTKTDAVLFRKDGTVLRRARFAGANPNACGIDRSAEILRQTIEEIRGDTLPQGIFAGVAGSVAANNKELLTAALKKHLHGIPFLLDSDIENVISSVRGADRCIAVICGTGSVIYAKDKEGLHRVGGYGYLFDNAGSGYDIGRDVLTACLEAGDGLIPSSLLTELATKQLGGAAWSNLNTLYRGGKDIIASFAPVAFEAARQGDKNGQKILQINFRRILQLIRFAQEKFDIKDCVICAGSIANTEEFRNAMQTGGIRPIGPKLPPVYGACVKCAALFTETDPTEFDRNFQTTLPN